MTILSPILISSYRRQVLSGLFSSSNLRTSLKQQVKAARDDQRPEVIFTVNHNLLWHMAHCPRIEDRQVALDIATGFEEVLEPLGPNFGASPMEASLEALPYSLVSFLLGPTESAWGQRIFPNLTVNWERSYGLMQTTEDQLSRVLRSLDIIGLLSHPFTDYLDQESFMRIEQDFAQFEARHQTKGPKLIFEQLIERDIFDGSLALSGQAHVPPYKSLLAPEKDLTLDHVRLALKSRNKGSSFTIGQHVMDLLSLPKADEQKIFKSKTHPDEIISSSLFSLGQDGGLEDYLFCLFIKNGMPIGYAVTRPTDRLKNSREVELHIFREFRGSASSSRLFSGFLKITHQQFRCTSFVIERDLSGKTLKESKLKPEDEEANTRFYERHEFEWGLDGRDWMYRVI